MLIWTNLNSFAINDISSLLQKSFSNRVCASFFANIKGLGTRFLVAVFVEFFDKIFYFVI